MKRSGFTLTEIMIALGVLITGMSLVAGALYAGLQCHNTASEDVVRDIVAENGLSTIKARLRHNTDASNGIKYDPQIIPDTLLNGLGTQDRRSPAFGGSYGTNFGYYAMGQRMATDYSNDYKFSMIAYKIIPGVNTSSTSSDYVQDYVQIGTSLNTTLSNYSKPDGTIVTQVSYRSKPVDGPNFNIGAIVIYPMGTTGRFSSGIVSSAIGASSVLLDKQILDAAGNSVTGVMNISTLTIYGPKKDAAGKIIDNTKIVVDTTAALSMLRAYQCRTSLPNKN